jgi:hypothetical protein
MPADRDSPMPVRPQRCRVRLEEVDGDLELSYRPPFSKAGGCLLFIWLIGWSVLCVMVVREVRARPTLIHFLGAVTLLASWRFVFFLFLNWSFGAVRLRLGLGGLDYRSSALVTLRRRHVPLAEIKRVRRGLISTRSRSDNTSEISYIIVVLLCLS